MGIMRCKPYLWREIESQVAVARERILNKQGHLSGKAQLDLLGKSCGLAKVDKVLERESQRHRLRQLNLHIQIRLLHVGVAAQRHGAIANVTIARELDAVLGRLDVDCNAVASEKGV